MKQESFWKVKPLPAVFGVVLVFLVIWNYFHILEVRGEVLDEINRLEGESSAIFQENARLKAINQALFEDAMKRLLENKELKSFLGDMEGEISALVEIAGCEICCYVGGQVAAMGPRLLYFKLMIDRFTSETENK